jgi:hypothetical protein
MHVFVALMVLLVQLRDGWHPVHLVPYHFCHSYRRLLAAMHDHICHHLYQIMFSVSSQMVEFSVRLIIEFSGLDSIFLKGLLKG